VNPIEFYQCLHLTDPDNDGCRTDCHWNASTIISWIRADHFHAVTYMEWSASACHFGNSFHSRPSSRAPAFFLPTRIMC
jgi:hypothetical protein